MKGLERSIDRGPLPKRFIIKDRFSLVDFEIGMDGATGVGWGTAEMGAVPKGNLLFLGCVADLEFKSEGSAGIIATWSGDIAIGTLPADSAVFTTDNSNVLAGGTTLPVGPAVAGAVAKARYGSTAIRPVDDNTDSDKELNINMLLDDASISADDQAILISGLIVMSYIKIG